MALLKTILSELGADLTYHRIEVSRFDFNVSKAYCRLASYLTEERRIDAIDKRVLSAEFVFDGEPDDGNQREWFYTQIKALPEWADASDA